MFGFFFYLFMGFMASSYSGTTCNSNGQVVTTSDETPDDPGTPDDPDTPDEPGDGPGGETGSNPPR